MDLTHFQDGRPRMVDVTEKPETFRTATAEAFVELTEEALSALEKGGVGKGDPLVVAQLAGILAAKKTADLIPLCHPEMHRRYRRGDGGHDRLRRRRPHRLRHAQGRFQGPRRLPGAPPPQGGGKERGVA